MRNLISDAPDMTRGYQVDFTAGYSYLNLHRA